MNSGGDPLLRDEFEVFATALLDVLIERGIVTHDMLKAAIEQAEAIHWYKDSTLAKAFHAAAPRQLQRSR